MDPAIGNWDKCSSCAKAEARGRDYPHEVGRSGSSMASSTNVPNGSLQRGDILGAAANEGRGVSSVTALGFLIYKLTVMIPRQMAVVEKEHLAALESSGQSPNNWGAASPASRSGSLVTPATSPLPSLVQKASSVASAETLVGADRSTISSPAEPISGSLTPSTLAPLSPAQRTSSAALTSNLVGTTSPTSSTPVKVIPQPMFATKIESPPFLPRILSQPAPNTVRPTRRSQKRSRRAAQIVRPAPTRWYMATSNDQSPTEVDSDVEEDQGTTEATTDVEEEQIHVEDKEEDLICLEGCADWVYKGPCHFEVDLLGSYAKKAESPVSPPASQLPSQLKDVPICLDDLSESTARDD